MYVACFLSKFLEFYLELGIIVDLFADGKVLDQLQQVLTNGYGC